MNDSNIFSAALPEGSLFKASSNSLGFKLKSFFRSKESLAAEMKGVLSDSESHLLAFVVQRHELRQIPHSAFHTLEATHMKIILSQLKGSQWYKTFSNLDTFEHSSIHRLLHPWMNGKPYERELVVLKDLKQNRFNVWMRLIGELLKNRPFSSGANGRVLLAIVREHYVDGKPIKTPLGAPPPPPPPGLFPNPWMKLAIQAPPTFPTPPKGTAVRNLNGPSPPPPGFRASYPSVPPGPPPPPPGKNTSPRLSDLTATTDYDAKTVMTTYNEYTLRVSESPEPGVPMTWLRATITQESNDKNAILRRVSQFQRTGRDIIEIKLRLSVHENYQITRLMEQIKASERDSRFGWTWVEMSLYQRGIEITNSVLAGSPNRPSVMHLIAKRSLKPSYKALDVYNALMKPPPRPPVSSPVAITPFPAPKKKSKYVDSSSESDSDGKSRSVL